MQNEVIRPIDGNALLEKMQYRLPVEDDISETVSNCARISRNLVEQAETLDVVPVVHGRWMRRGNETKCSRCKFIYYSNHDDFNYCPNCGARMDGDGDGN